MSDSSELYSLQLLKGAKPQSSKRPHRIGAESKLPVLLAAKRGDTLETVLTIHEDEKQQESREEDSQQPGSHPGHSDSGECMRDMMVCCICTNNSDSSM